MEFTIQGHKIDVPDDMDVYITSNTVAGDYDYIAYRGWEIVPAVADDGETLIGFNADPSGEELSSFVLFDTLAEVRKFIDDNPVNPDDYFPTTDPDYRRDSEKNSDLPDRLENLIDDYDPDPGD